MFMYYYGSCDILYRNGQCFCLRRDSLVRNRNSCPGSGSRVNVIYNGLNKVEASEEKCALSPQGPYIYATASKLPHKNAAGVLRTYDAYFHQTDDPVRLVVVGIPGTEEFEISEEASDMVVIQLIQGCRVPVRGFVFVDDECAYTFNQVATIKPLAIQVQLQLEALFERELAAVT